VPREITKNIGLGSIHVRAERLRALRPDTVHELMESMAERGQLQPIVLRPRPSSGYLLVAGRHRYEAAKKLKWKSIRASIFDAMDADSAELAEIDENLIRADLSPAERALHIDARKTLYEKVHPETKHGGSPGKAGGGKKAKNAKIASFGDDTASKTGKAKRTIALDATRGKAGKAWLKHVAGTSLDQGVEIDALIKLPESERNELIQRAKTDKKISAKFHLKKYTREQRHQAIRDAAKRAKTDPLLGPYLLLYADPPWPFETFSEKGLGSSPVMHYPVLSFKKIENFKIKGKPISEIAAKNAALYMWCTSSNIEHAIAAMKAWDFKYKTQAAWIKNRTGMGYVFLNQHELLLYGTRGNKMPAPQFIRSSVFDGIRDEAFRCGPHSEKPAEVRNILEKMYPDFDKSTRLELFARGKSPEGWTFFGDQAFLK
jgi:N6-adenosine-specific RNA methylase IME4